MKSYLSLMPFAVTCVSGCLLGYIWSEITMLAPHRRGMLVMRGIRRIGKAICSVIGVACECHNVYCTAATNTTTTTTTTTTTMTTTTTAIGSYLGRATIQPLLLVYRAPGHAGGTVRAALRIWPRAQHLGRVGEPRSDIGMSGRASR